MNGLFRFSSALAPRASIAGLRCASSIAYGHAPERTQKLERNQAIEDGDGIPTYVEYVEYFDLNGNPENYTQAHDHGHGHGHGDHDAHHNEQNPGDSFPIPHGPGFKTAASIWGFIGIAGAVPVIAVLWAKHKRASA